jgi:hypothetical protein
MRCQRLVLPRARRQQAARSTTAAYQANWIALAADVITRDVISAELLIGPQRKGRFKSFVSIRLSDA